MTQIHNENNQNQIPEIEKHRQMIIEVKDALSTIYRNYSESIYVGMMGGNDITEEAVMWDIRITLKKEHHLLKTEIENYIKNLLSLPQYRMKNGYQTSIGW